MLVLAHRGYHADAAENTLAAFEAAVKFGVDGIETDLRFTRDGLPVLFHDARVGDGAEVAALTRTELAVAAGHAVPTLDEALGGWPGVLWNVEIKAPAPARAIVAALSPYVHSHRLLLTSFDHALIAAVSGKIPSECGFLLGERPENLAAVLAHGQPHPNLRTIVSHFKIVDDRLLGEIRAAGYRSFVYGVGAAQEHEACRRLGLEGVITDSPGYLLDKT